jgi:hypothetical protein
MCFISDLSFSTAQGEAKREGEKGRRRGEVPRFPGDKRELKGTAANRSSRQIR